MDTDIEILNQQYLVLVERISRMPMSEASRARVLAEVQAIYRRQKLGTVLAQLLTRTGNDPRRPATPGNH